MWIDNTGTVIYSTNNDFEIFSKRGGRYEEIYYTACGPLF